jgi:hypothetical protein
VFVKIRLQYTNLLKENILNHEVPPGVFIINNDAAEVTEAISDEKKDKECKCAIDEHVGLARVAIDILKHALILGWQQKTPLIMI